MAKQDAYRGVCTNRQCSGTFGHFPNEPIPAFCPRCGSGVIGACPACKAPLEELIENPYGDPPNNCMKCGEKLRH
jgi:hypothetical protein